MVSAPPGRRRAGRVQVRRWRPCQRGDRHPGAHGAVQRGRWTSDQRMMFRIGVHLGEVIVDEENHDLFGDGVNLAERIQAMAEPGGIARVARRARRHRAAGRLRLRRWRRAPGQNVSRAVQIFHRPSSGAASRQPRPDPDRARHLHFQAPILAVTKYGFELALERLLAKTLPEAHWRSAALPTSVSGVVAHRHHFAPPRAPVSGRGAADRRSGLDQRHGGGRQGAETGRARLPLQSGAKLRLGDVELHVRQRLIPAPIR